MRRHWPEIAVVLLSAAAATFAARPYADGFNDGRRLATIQTLGERGTFVLDESLFTGPSFHPGRPNPYNPARESLRITGTLDLVLIDGHFYSDKPPVPALLAGGCHRLWRACGGATAADDPDGFCLRATVLSSGVPFVVAVLAMVRLAKTVGLSNPWSFLLSLSFGAGTLALVYVRHVNGHIQMLGAAAVVCGLLAELEVEPKRRTVLALGFFAGLGATLELGIGPLLLLLSVVAVYSRSRSLGTVAWLVLGALPWLALHAALNYGIGHTLRPLGSVMQYLDYPCSAFGVQNATGTWRHDSIGAFATYAYHLLFGDNGFLPFHPTVWLAIPAALLALHRPKPALWILLGWPLSAWLLYAATSNNYSGSCCSIRWFVPLSAPAYWMLGLLLKQRPGNRLEFLWLGLMGGAIGAWCFPDGPWEFQSAWDLWPAITAAGAGWLLIRAVRVVRSCGLVL